MLALVRPHLTSSLCWLVLGWWLVHYGRHDATQPPPRWAVASGLSVSSLGPALKARERQDHQDI